jgi:hypothetical protein
VDAALQQVFSVAPGAHPVIPSDSPAEGALGEAIRRAAALPLRSSGGY